MTDPRRHPWEDILEEVRRLREEGAHREKELWAAVEEIRALLSDLEVDVRAARSNDDAESYTLLKRRLRRFVAQAIPPGGRVAVVSRGDPELLELPGCRAEHYPRDLAGEYLGFYPADGTAAIAHLEWVRAQGAEYLLFPETASWWLRDFPRLASHLEERFTRIAERDGIGILYQIRSGSAGTSDGSDWLGQVLDAWEEHTGTPLSVLDWNTGARLAERLVGRNVFSPIRPEPPLPYLDRSVDIVAVADGSEAVLAEARRIAQRTVVRFPQLAEAAPSGGRRPLVMEHRDGLLPTPPPVSIVVPTHDGLAHLVPCLRALGDTLPAREDVEVVVVDDASATETSEALARLEASLPWLRVVRHATNGGFIAACNTGAKEAQGEFLVFLNDDTVPLPGWLGALMRTFRAHPDAGAVGGRLVYPDGRLQEAGGVIYQDGRGANLGRGDHETDAPLYSHVRRVHYCSGALLATRRELFLRLGGFDTRYHPAYYEDADYCFAVRRAGLQVYYQPEAVVVHVEGASSGTDPRSGVKRHQMLNQARFREKWSAELRELQPAPGAYTTETWYRLAFAEVRT